MVKLCPYLASGHFESEFTLHYFVHERTLLSGHGIPGKRRLADEKTG